MKTIGQYLRSSRKKKGISIGNLSDVTKIKESFLAALEKEKWQELPEFSVISGFVKSIAGELGASRDQASALLRRDYPPKMVVSQPKAEIRREFRISPQLTFFIGVGAVIVVIAVYLVAQYISFVRPPALVVAVPAENQVVLTRGLIVSGKTDPNTTVIVNTQPALVEEDGDFTTTIEINDNTNTVEVVATSRAGKETRVRRTIRPEFQ